MTYFQGERSDGPVLKEGGRRRRRREKRGRRRGRRGRRGRRRRGRRGRRALTSVVCSFSIISIIIPPAKLHCASRSPASAFCLKMSTPSARTSAAG
jgi:hypothetical protein